MRTHVMMDALHGLWHGDDDNEGKLAALRDDFGHAYRIWRAMAADRSPTDWCAHRVYPRGDDSDQMTEPTAEALWERLAAQS